ncbi:MAG: DNA polymerase IV [Gammaproteobacteria bacterium]|jgi:DNA polymerase-4
MIIHADMDAFYVSVELLDKPQLRDKPVAVGGPSRTRGVVSAANYIARQYGVHSALPCAIATRRCPDLVLLKPRIAIYAEYSQKIKNIFLRYTPVIEPLALDEAFLDAEASKKLFGDSPSIGRKIKQDIKNELGLTVSIGIAPNKFIAKIASDIDKPDGFVVVRPGEIQQFLDPLPVTRIWGIGKVSSAKLKRRHIHTIGDLRKLPQSQLREWFGKHGDHLHQLANGIDPRPVVTDHQAKSISHECTYDEDLHDTGTIEAQLLHLTEQVAARIRHSELKGRTITIKVRYGDFKTITRSHSVTEPTNNTAAVWQVVKQELIPRVDLSRQGIRLLGVGVSHFNDLSNATEQIDLFEQNTQQASHIDELTDAINEKFGQQAIRRGKTVFKP